MQEPMLVDHDEKTTHQWQTVSHTAGFRPRVTAIEFHCVWVAVRWSAFSSPGKTLWVTILKHDWRFWCLNLYVDYSVKCTVYVGHALSPHTFSRSLRHAHTGRHTPFLSLSLCPALSLPFHLFPPTYTLCPASTLCSLEVVGTYVFVFTLVLEMKP